MKKMFFAVLIVALMVSLCACGADKTTGVYPIATPTIGATSTPAEGPTVTPTSTPTAAPTEEPTGVPTEHPTDVPIATPTATPTPRPTVTPKPTATPAPSPTPNVADSVGLEYSVNEDGVTCTITGIGSCTDEHLIIGSEIDGYTVTAIGVQAFLYCDDLIRITIPGSVETVGKQAFRE